MGKARWIKLILFILLSAGMIGSSLWYAYDTASQPGLHDYVGDEVWYVSASRNILHRLGFDVHYIHNGYEGVNVIFSDDSAKLKYRHVIDEGLVKFDGNLSAEVSYEKFPAVYVEVPREKLNDFFSYLGEEIPEGEFYVVTGFRYPDAEGIQNYLNTEHPFLGKDLIMLGMLIWGDKPISWRLPGIVLYGFLELLVLLTAYRVTRSYLASLIALFFAAVDPLLQATAVAAMLDIYVAVFVGLFVFLFVYSRDFSTGFSAGLAGATKLSGSFGYPVFFIKLIRDIAKEADLRKGLRMLIIFVLLGGTITAYAEALAGYWDGIYYKVLVLLTVIAIAEFSISSRAYSNTLLKFLTAGLFLPLIGFLLPEIPAIKVVGLNQWLRDFLGSFKWHLSDKGGHVYASPFWQWFYNGNPFHLHFDPDVVAITNPTLLLFTIVAIFAVPYVWKRRGEGALIPFGVFWSTLLLFALQYVLGGKTQFSFYATALVPPATVIMGVFLYDLIKWEAFVDSLLDYLLWLGRILRIKRIVQYVESKRKTEEENETSQSEASRMFPLVPVVYTAHNGLPRKNPTPRLIKRKESRPGGLPKKWEDKTENREAEEP